MGINDKKPGFQPPKDTTTTYDEQKQGTPVNMVPSESGLYHTVVPIKNLNFKVAPNEAVIQQGGAYIVLGTDRPSTTATGAGAYGFTGANSIDMVVGRGASLGKPGDWGVKADAHVDPMFFADAARVLITQLSEVDKNFGLAEGMAGDCKDGSAVVAKADNVRLIGRNSIKIVTGKGSGVSGFGSGGERTSTGGKKVEPAPSIELIAGNSSAQRVVWGGIKNITQTIDLVQRAAMGENLKAALDELNEIVGQIWSALFNFVLGENVFDVAVGIDPLRPWVASAAAPAGMTKIEWVLNSLWHTRIKSTLWVHNYLEPTGYMYVCSTNVKLT